MKQQTHRYATLAVVLTAYLMIILDILIVITGLPDIRETMEVSPVTLSWVQNAYLLSCGGFLLLAARMGDMEGRKRVRRIGIILFTLASLVIGIAQTPVELITARAVQGIGGAYPCRDRTRQGFRFEIPLADVAEGCKAMEERRAFKSLLRGRGGRSDILWRDNLEGHGGVDR